MKTKLLKIFTLMIAFGVLFTSCDTDLSTPDVDDESLQDGALGERAVGDVFGMVNTGPGSGKAAGDCGIFTFDIGSRILTITFPNEGCTGNDGVIRSGVINAAFSGTWLEPGSSVEITFVNYKRDGKTLSGTITVVYTSGGEQPVFTLTAINMSLTFPDSKQITWESSNTFTWLVGATTPDKMDDVYSISGATEGTARNGKEFKRVATELVTSATCRWFTSGNLVLTIYDGDNEDIYNMTFSEPCGTVTIIYNGITITRNFES